MRRVFTPWKSANAASQLHPPVVIIIISQLLEIYQHTPNITAPFARYKLPSSFVPQCKWGFPREAFSAPQLECGSHSRDSLRMWGGAWDQLSQDSCEKGRTCPVGSLCPLGLGMMSSFCTPPPRNRWFSFFCLESLKLPPVSGRAQACILPSHWWEFLPKPPSLPFCLAKPSKVATHILTFARPLGFSKPSPSLRHPSSPLPGPPHCPRIPSALPLTHLASRLCPIVNQLHFSEN